MPGSNLFLYLDCILAGFFLGSIMNSDWIPKKLLHTDICQISSDSNPGATNVFLHCGPYWGSICLILDVLKGFLPVFLGCHILHPNSMLFSLVIAAPVLGHAIAPLNHFHGGKCIATSFGVLLGLIPFSYAAGLLAVIYILFSTLVKISPTRIRSIAAFSLFGLLEFFFSLEKSQYSVALGCLMISLTAIFKHSKHFSKHICTP